MLNRYRVKHVQWLLPIAAHYLSPLITLRQMANRFRRYLISVPSSHGYWGLFSGICVFLCFNDSNSLLWVKSLSFNLLCSILSGSLLCLNSSRSLEPQAMRANASCSYSIECIFISCYWYIQSFYNILSISGICLVLRLSSPAILLISFLISEILALPY